MDRFTPDRGQPVPSPLPHHFCVVQLQTNTDNTNQFRSCGYPKSPAQTTEARTLFAQGIAHI